MYMWKCICKRYGDSSWTSWTEPRKCLTTRHLQLLNHVQVGFEVLSSWTLAWPLLYRGRSSSAKQVCTVAFRKVTDCRMLKICVSALKSVCWNFTKFSENLQKGWKATGARLLHHSSLVWLVPMWTVSTLWDNCDSSFWELLPNLAKPPKMVEGMLKITESGAQYI